MEELKTTQDRILQSLDVTASAMTADEVEYRQFVDECLIFKDRQYKAKEFLLKVKGIETLSIGDLHLIQAKAKQGKTSAVTLMVGACLGGEVGPLESAQAEPIKIVVFDTEQFVSDTYKQYCNMLSIGGMEQEDHSRLSVFNLRLCSFEQRRQLICDVIRRERPQLAVIDGIRDLTPDINHPTECPKFVEEMMQLATETDCAILGILHENPAVDKARGWLGTEWVNKCGYSFKVVKSGSTVTVKTPVHRGAPLPDWQFTFGEDGKPTCDKAFLRHRREIDAQEKKLKKTKTQEYQEKLIDELNRVGGRMKRSEFVAMLTGTGLYVRSTVQTNIKRMIESPDSPLAADGEYIFVKKTDNTQNDVQADATIF